jgi:hypothetical protein
MADSTLADLVLSEEFKTILSVFRSEMRDLKGQLANLDPLDPALAAKAAEKLHRIRAIRALALRFYTDVKDPDPKERILFLDD